MPGLFRYDIQACHLPTPALQLQLLPSACSMNWMSRLSRFSPRAIAAFPRRSSKAGVYPLNTPNIRVLLHCGASTSCCTESCMHSAHELCAKRTKLQQQSGNKHAAPPCQCPHLCISGHLALLLARYDQHARHCLARHLSNLQKPQMVYHAPQLWHQFCCVPKYKVHERCRWLRI